MKQMDRAHRTPHQQVLSDNSICKKHFVHQKYINWGQKSQVTCKLPYKQSHYSSWQPHGFLTPFNLSLTEIFTFEQKAWIEGASERGVWVSSFPDKGNGQTKELPLDFPSPHSGTSPHEHINGQEEPEAGGQSRPTLGWWRERNLIDPGFASFPFHAHFLFLPEWVPPLLQFKARQEARAGQP